MSIINNVLSKVVGSRHDRAIKKFTKLVAEINSFEKDMQSLSDDELGAKTQQFREKLDKEDFITLEELRDKHDLLATGSWDQAFDKVDERRKQYILTLQRNGEDILPTSKPRIRLSTIHGAKGDEDENIVHFLDLDILSYNEFQRNPNPEHRLQFVGVTRTISNLYLVNPTGQYGYQI